jgi:hypothetical protein
MLAGKYNDAINTGLASLGGAGLSLTLNALLNQDENSKPADRRLLEAVGSAMIAGGLAQGFKDGTTLIGAPQNRLGGSIKKIISTLPTVNLLDSTSSKYQSKYKNVANTLARPTELDPSVSKYAKSAYGINLNARPQSDTFINPVRINQTVSTPSYIQEGVGQPNVSFERLLSGSKLNLDALQNRGATNSIPQYTSNLALKTNPSLDIPISNNEFRTRSDGTQVPQGTVLNPRNDIYFSFGGRRANIPLERTLIDELYKGETITPPVSLQIEDINKRIQLNKLIDYGYVPASAVLGTAANGLLSMGIPYIPSTPKTEIVNSELPLTSGNSEDNLMAYYA